MTVKEYKNSNIKENENLTLPKNEFQEKQIKL